jgi:hypothetical protein
LKTPIGKRATDAASPEAEDRASLEVSPPTDGQALLLTESGESACPTRRSIDLDAASANASSEARSTDGWTLRQPDENADLLRDVAEALRKGDSTASRLRAAIRRLGGSAVHEGELPGTEAATSRRRLH